MRDTWRAAGASRAALVLLAVGVLVGALVGGLAGVWGKEPGAGVLVRVSGEPGAMDGLKVLRESAPGAEGESGGELAWRVAPYGDRASVQSWRVEAAGDAPVRIREVRTGWGAFGAGALAAGAGEAGGWREDAGAAESTRAGAVLRSYALGPGLKMELETGPSLGAARVWMNGVTREVDLRAPVAGVVVLTAGAHEREVLVEVPAEGTERPVRLRFAAPSGAVRVLEARTGRGVALVEGDAVLWDPGAGAGLTRGAGAVLAGVGAGAWVVLCGVAARVRSAGGGAGRGRALLVVWSLGYALLMLLLFFPGLVTGDTTGRATQAAYLTGHMPVDVQAAHPWQVHWFEPGMMLGFTAAQRAGGLWVHTLAQAWWMAWAIGWVCTLVAGKRGLFVWAVLLALPPTWSHASAMLPDAATIAALASIAGVLIWWGRRRTCSGAGVGEGAGRPEGWKVACALALFAISVVVLITYRANSLTTAPVIAGLALWAVRPWQRAVVYAGVVAGAIALAAWLPRAIPWQRQDTLAASLVWEHLGTLKVAGDEALARRHHVDAVCRGRAGDAPGDATLRAVAAHEWWAHDSLIWGAQGLDVPKLLERPSPARGAWKELVRAEPVLYARAKLRIWALLLGVTHHGVPVVMIDQLWNRAEEFASVDLRPRGLWGVVGSRGLEAAIDASAWWKWAFTPLAHGVVALGATLLVWKRRERLPVVVLWLLAGAYYGAFFVITPGLHLRYYLPSMVLLVAVVAWAWGGRVSWGRVGGGRGEAAGAGPGTETGPGTR